jgi:hypothetical protein
MKRNDGLRSLDLLTSRRAKERICFNVVKREVHTIMVTPQLSQLEDGKLMLRDTHFLEYNGSKGRRCGVFFDKIYEGIEPNHQAFGS